MGKLDEAIKCFHEAIRLQAKNSLAWCNLGHALTQQGKFSEGLVAMRGGHELGSSEPDWPYPSARWVQDTERYLKAEQKLDAVLRGEIKPGDPMEQLALAQVCFKHKQRPAAAARFYAGALKANLFLAQPATQNRYTAACAATLAADGQGIDATATSADERAAFRKQAYDWLSAEMSAWGRLLDARAPATTGLDQSLKTWQTNPELASVRDASALAKLSVEERTSWQKFWSDLATLQERAYKTKS